MSMIRSFAGNCDKSGVRCWWIFELEDNRAIGDWLHDLVGNEVLKFYGAFINWAYQHANKAKDPTTKYKSAEDEAETRFVFEVLRKEYPADQGRFCELMRVYWDRYYMNGVLPRGVISRPEYENMPWIRAGEKKLWDKVWDKKEREAMWVAVGNDLAHFDAAGKDRRKKKAAKRRERNALESERAMGDWEESRDAIEDAGVEAEIDGAMASLEQTEIGPRQAWEEELVDRTNK